MIQVRNIASKCFRPMVKNMLIFDPTIHKDLYYHKRNHLNTSEQKFHGSYLCGLSTYILGYYYYKTYDTQIIKSSFGYGDYYEDHCYLLLNNEIIVDPTIRQFLNDHRDNGFSDYSRFIYGDTHPIFVGNFHTLTKYLSILEELNKKTFGSTSIKSSQLIKYWHGKDNMTYKLDQLISYTEGKSIPVDKYNKRLITNIISGI